MRERYSVVYGARLKVRDGQNLEKGQTLVEWDPYTFSILTESGGHIRFKDIIDKVTVHEEVDEITGMSRLIIVDSPDEKKQPAQCRCSLSIPRGDRRQWLDDTGGGYGLSTLRLLTIPRPVP